MSVQTVAASVYKWSSGTTFNLHPSSAASRLYTSIRVQDNAFGVSNAQLELLNYDGINSGTWTVGDRLKIVSKSKVLFYGKVGIPRFVAGGKIIQITAQGARSNLKKIEITSENPQAYPTVDSESDTNTAPKVVDWITTYTVNPEMPSYWNFSRVGPPHHLKWSRGTSGTVMVTLKDVSIDTSFSEIGNAVNMVYYIDPTTFNPTSLYFVPNAPGICYGSSNASYGYDDFHNVSISGNAITSYLKWDVNDNNNWSWTGEGRIQVNTNPAPASDGMRLTSTSWSNIGSPSNCNAAIEAVVFYDKTSLQNGDYIDNLCLRVASTDFKDYYGIQLWYSGSGVSNCRLVKRVGGAYVQLGSYVDIPTQNKEQHILGLSTRSTSAGVIVNGYVDHKLMISYTNSSGTISGGRPGLFFKGTSYVEAEIDNVTIYPSTTSFTYDLDSGDVIDLSGGYDITTAYNDITVYGALAIDGKYNSDDIKNRSPPRPLGHVTDTRSIDDYGKRSLQRTNIFVRNDRFATKSALSLLHDLRKPRVIKTIEIVGATTIPEKFSQLVRIVSDDTNLGGLYYVRSREWNLSPPNQYTVTLSCEEVFLE